MSKELTVEKHESLESALIEVVKRKDIDPERLEKFLDLQVKMENRQAEKAFFQAMSNFQGKCPTIVKRKKVSFGKTNYDYAPLDEMVETIKPFLQKNGLSFSFCVKNSGEFMEVVTTIYHIEGFKREYTYTTHAIHDDERMNMSQRRKSALTYAKRAGLENALGLVTAGEDDDAARAKDKMVTEDQKQEILTLIKNTKTNEVDFFKFMKVEYIEEMSELEGRRAINALRQKKEMN